MSVLIEPKRCNQGYLCCSIDETWRLWQRFSEDSHKFEGWLTEHEKRAQSPRTHLPFSAMKKELAKFEVQAYTCFVH